MPSGEEVTMSDVAAWAILLALFVGWSAICAWNPFVGVGIAMLAGGIAALLGWE